MFGKKEIDLDLRSDANTVTKSIERFSTICWCLLLGAIVITALAIPVVRNFLSSTFGLKLTKSWSKLLFQIDFLFLAAILIVSGIGLFINSFRHRRRTDRYNISLIYFLVLSALCMGGYLIFFKGII
ncbi:MAG TPA: hypothetical protein DDW65_10730 [Firmicutes bacterium]|jgi:hypothetical protein|nr:hypothetical protein [Bacillota bacterium]